MQERNLSLMIQGHEIWLEWLISAGFCHLSFFPMESGERRFYLRAMIAIQ